VTGPVQLGVDLRPVGNRPGQDRRRRSGPPEEPLFNAAVIEIVWQRPGQTRCRCSLEIVADRRLGQARRDRDLGWSQVLRLGKPQDFSDLAHGSTGTGHRHLSSTNDIEAEGAVSDELTSVLLAASGTQVVISRETGGQNR